MAPVLGKHILTKTLHESVTSCAADCKKHPQFTAFDFNTNSVRTVCKTLKDDFRSNCAKNPQNGQHFRLVIGLFFALYLVLWWFPTHNSVFRPLGHNWNYNRLKFIKPKLSVVKKYLNLTIFMEFSLFISPKTSWRSSFQIVRCHFGAGNVNCGLHFMRTEW